MTAHEELAQYEGSPKCQDCKWKLGSDITNNCSCRGKTAVIDTKLHVSAMERARELQAEVKRVADEVSASQG